MAGALLAYVEARPQEGAANATINRELEVVSRAFTLTAEWGKLAYAPKVPSLREDHARHAVATDPVLARAPPAQCRGPSTSSSGCDLPPRSTEPTDSPRRVFRPDSRVTSRPTYGRDEGLRSEAVIGAFQSHARLAS